MSRYPKTFIEKVRTLRSEGKTYAEIRFLLKRQVPKSTLFEWCKNTLLPQSYAQMIVNLNLSNLGKARIVALEINRSKREKYLLDIEKKNVPISGRVHNIETAKIALAMLCLGEASKSTRKTPFYFGNSDPKIILLFLILLKRCFPFNEEKLRCTVQCRADQDIEELEQFWAEVTHIPRRLFYKGRIDPRTIGKPTKNTNYKGVLRIDYFDNKVRLELESLANLVYNQLVKEGPVA